MKIIKGSKNMRYAGHYDLHKPVIRIHPSLKGNDRKLVIHHERVERTKRIKHGWSYKKAHKYATKSEKRYAKKLKVNWKKYGNRINNLYSRRKK
jgi:hypothetical protein